MNMNDRKVEMRHIPALCFQAANNGSLIELGQPSSKMASSVLRQVMISTEEGNPTWSLLNAQRMMLTCEKHRVVLAVETSMIHFVETWTISAMPQIH